MGRGSKRDKAVQPTDIARKDAKKKALKKVNSGDEMIFLRVIHDTPSSTAFAIALVHAHALLIPY